MEVLSLRDLCGAGPSSTLACSQAASAFCFLNPLPRAPEMRSGRANGVMRAWPGPGVYSSYSRSCGQRSKGSGAVVRSAGVQAPELKS